MESTKNPEGFYLFLGRHLNNTELKRTFYCRCGVGLYLDSFTVSSPSAYFLFDTVSTSIRNHRNPFQSLHKKSYPCINSTNQKTPIPSFFISPDFYEIKTISHTNGRLRNQGTGDNSDDSARYPGGRTDGVKERVWG